MTSPIETVIRKTVNKGVMKIASFNRARMPALDKPHPFLTGLHQPMDREVTLDRLAVAGTIPAALDGRYVRIGPNPVRPPNPAAYHWFTGDGMVHGVRLKDGKALWYRNRWIRSKAVSARIERASCARPAQHAQRYGQHQRARARRQDLGAGRSGRLPGRNRRRPGNHRAQSLRRHAERLIQRPSAPRPATGEMHAICYNGPDLNTIRHVVVGRDGKVRREEPIAVSHGPSVHDCMLTDKYVLVFDLPVTFSMKTLLAGHPFPYSWNPAHPARVGLLPREGRGNDVVWCEVEPCYVFHPCNAFETEDGRVIVDVVAHATMFAESTLGPDSKSVKFERWTIDPQARRVASESHRSRAAGIPALRRAPHRQALPLRVYGAARQGGRSVRAGIAPHQARPRVRQARCP